MPHFNLFSSADCTRQPPCEISLFSYRMHHLSDTSLCVVCLPAALRGSGECVWVWSALLCTYWGGGTFPKLWTMKTALASLPFQSRLLQKAFLAISLAPSPFQETPRLDLVITGTWLSAWLLEFILVTTVMLFPVSCPPLACMVLCFLL